MRGRYLWAAVAGLLLAAAFPRFEVAGLAWVMPGTILLMGCGGTGKETFRVGFVAGMAHYLASLYWLLLIPVPLTWKWAPALGWLALGSFLASFMGVWVWLSWRIYPAQMAGIGGGIAVREWAGKFLTVSWARRISWALASAAMWVAVEMFLARIFGGFPWNLLGDSQYRMTPLIQLASATGVYGVSFLVVWTSVSLIGVAMAAVGRPGVRQVLFAELIIPMATVAALYAAGYRKLARGEPPRPGVTVALVQPSIPQSVIWDAAEDSRRFQQLLELSQRALSNKVDILIWPESSVPGFIRWDANFAEGIEGLARSNHTWMIIGADDYEAPPGAKTLGDCDLFNSSFLINQDGMITGQYRKQRLVMFGEYVPFTRVLPFMKYLTPIGQGFVPGPGPVPFNLTNLNVKVSVLICFEDIFPQLARKYVRDDTDFLVNLTNNGWFGEGAAQRQHAAAAIFRAVENGVPLVRCSNNGLTCWVDAKGRIREEFVSERGGIYGEGFMVARIPALLPGEKRAATFYRLHGDWFGWTCVGFALLKAALSWWKGGKRD